MMQRLSILFLTAMVAGCSGQDRSRVDESPEAPRTAATHLPGAKIGMSGCRTIIAYRGAMTRVAQYSPGEYGLDILTTEGHEGTVYRSQHSLTTSFAISLVAERHPDEIFVAGVDPATQEVVIERWRGTAPVGAMQGAMFEAQTGIGVPCDLHWPSVTIVGGTFLPPADRGPRLPPARAVVYRGTDFTGVSGMVADPEGRFLLVQDEATGDIKRVTAGGTPQTIVSAATIPQAPSASLVSPYQDAFDDRVYAFLLHIDGVPPSYLVLHDASNDGEFENIGVMSFEAFRQAYPPEEIGGPYQGMR